MALFATVKAKGNTVKIYTVKNRGRPYFKLSYLWAGQWQQRMMRYASPRDAERARYTAREIALAIATGRLEQVEDVGEAMRLLRSAEDSLSTVGVPVDEAAREYAEARKLVGGNILEAAVFFAKNKGRIKEEIPVRDAVERFIAAQKADRASRKYLEDIRSRLRRFARENGGLLSELTTAEVKIWLRNLNVAPRTRNNFLSLIKTFFNWAKSEGFIPKDVPTEVDEIGKIAAPTEIRIHDPDTVLKVMAGALEHDPVIIPYLAIGYFAAVRPNEMRRMDASAIRWSHNDIEVKDWQAKGTRRKAHRRLIPMQPNLAAWLRFSPPDGPLATSWTRNRVGRLAKKLKVDWPPDVMRHTAISNLVSLTQNVDQVALWAGNTRQIILTNYLRQVSEREAKLYFSIAPPEDAKIVQFGM